MIISTKKGAPQAELDRIIDNFEHQGLSVTLIRGTDYNVFGLVGDTTKIAEKDVLANPWVENVTRVSAPYKRANRLFHPDDTVVDVNGIKIGGKSPIAVMAGPCSVEGEEHTLKMAKLVKAGGANFLRGGAYKPRTSPYSFQGLGTEGILDLVKAREATGLPIVSELMDEAHIDEFEEYVDIVQIGARNMQNFQLLKAVGKMHKPILLKRGLANTIEEWIMSAEYIMAGGNENVILCERGIRTFERATRNTLDLSAVPVIKEKTHLPIISRLSGQATVPPSKSAAHRAVLCAALADGVSHITNIEYSQDIRATLGAVTQLGAKVAEEPAAVTITGRGSSGGFVTVTRPVFCNESGSTLRFMIPLFSLTAQKVRFTGAGRLFDRPQAVYQMLFDRQGLRFEQTPDGITVFGRLRPGGFTLPGDVSSQFISGLLFAAPLMESESSIEVLPPYESRSYVDLTIDAMQQFGVKVAARARKNGSVMYRVAAPQRYTASDFAVEGDYSQAAFLAVLGCAVGGINVVGLNPDSQQGDKVILDILKRCGGKFKPIEGGYRFERSLLKATEIDLADCPDLGPILFTLGCFCNGSTVIRNAGRLRLKESDRISAMQEELKKMGARIEVDGDTVTITGVALHAPAEPLYSHNDHRIVMALAVAVYAAGLPALLRGAEAVNKSWPAFWDTLRGLGAKIDTE